MDNISHNNYIFNDTKPHYMILDGLRGVAALLVVCYHIFEGFAFASGGSINTLNHGYLAVDFFFMLSGFVISYAYDNRWKNELTIISFLKRRLIRLHPMIVMGAIIGFTTFLIGGCSHWDGTQVNITTALISLVCTILLIPAIPSATHEVRGNGEMYPLNGPYWSLFFEYIGNILYATIIRKASTQTLKYIIIMLGICHIWFAVGNISQYGCIGVGWTIDTINFWGGLLRMSLPFSIGMYLARTFTPQKIKHSFSICSIALVALFSAPYINETFGIHMNGVYETICVIIIFPIIVRLGASGILTNSTSTNLCRILGNISYPLYVVHYPIMYLFYAWLIDNKLYTLSETWHIALITIVTSIILAYLCLKLYDIPIRKYLSKS